MTDSKKPALYLTGPSKGPPTIDDITALYKSLTGRDPTPEELAESKAMLEKHAASRKAGE
jgi:hypothetical protein